ncbi:uncharacterized protein [Narcine bancroftii]|uniref:uncharacterized protein n=1 Tax=Narcine bancroftii TaxID=1343680 RepID=UPI0038319846
MTDNLHVRFGIHRLLLRERGCPGDGVTMWREAGPGAPHAPCRSVAPWSPESFSGGRPSSCRILQSFFHRSKLNTTLSEEHVSFRNTAGEDHISTSADFQTGNDASEVTLGNVGELQGQSKMTEVFSSENPNQDHDVEASFLNSTLTTRSHSLAERAVPKSGSHEALSSISNAQNSLEESSNRFDKAIGALSNVIGSQPEMEPESSHEGLFSTSSALTSKTNRVSSHTVPEGKEDQNQMTTMETQTAWVSLNTPGSSLTEIPKEFKLLDFKTDPETRSEEPAFEDLELNPPDSNERTENTDPEVEEAETHRVKRFQVAIVKTSNVVTCEFCRQVQMPFPTPQLLDTTNPEKLFCCNMSWELYQQILQNREENVDYEEPLFDLDGFHPNKKEVEEAVKKLTERVKSPEVMMYMTSVIHGDKVIFTNLKTISYRLSSDFCRRQGWTLGPPQVKALTFEDLLQYMPSVQSNKGTEKPLDIVEKYYPDGCKFVTMFSDGAEYCPGPRLVRRKWTLTRMKIYPSGNVAIVISAFHHDQLVHVLFEDLDWNAKMLGVFQSTGHGTCYLPNGLIWINLTPQRGLYFTEQGLLRKRWWWQDYSCHIHAPPYNSISLKLNPNITVQIISQDQIYSTFKTKNRSIQFNMGANLVLRDVEQPQSVKSGITEEEDYISKAKQKLHMFLEQMRRCKHQWRLKMETSEGMMCKPLLKL